MKLQILIPQYNESEEIISVLLNSIQIQQNVSFSDFGVIICSDGCEICPSKEFLSEYTYPIEYRWLSHRGVSATRNALLDLATADYIMFCDADDMFFWPYALEIIFNAIDDKKFDYMTSDFIEEVGIRGEAKRSYARHGEETLFVHGKVFRREMLNMNNIRFYDSLTMSEDYGFNKLAKHYAKIYYHCEQPFYMWVWREDSTCRNDIKGQYSNFPPVIICRAMTIYDFLNRKVLLEALYELVILVQDVYCTTRSEDWKDPIAEPYIKQSEELFKQYIVPIAQLWFFIANDDELRIMKERDEKSSVKVNMEKYKKAIEWANSMLSEYYNKNENN